MTIFKYLLIINSFLFSHYSYSQKQLPALSPRTQITQNVGYNTISLNYSSPSSRGRKVFGGLVPFNFIWRTGANDDTKITFKESVIINNTKIKAGEYVIFSIPNKTSWEIILYQKEENESHGIPDIHKKNNYKWEENKVKVRIKTPVIQVADNVETFSISFKDIKYNSTTLLFSWANTVVKFKIETDSDSKVNSFIKNVEDNEPSFYNYYQIAAFYLATSTDEQSLKKGLKYANKSLELWKDNEAKYRILLIKSKCLFKLDKTNEAIQLAEQGLMVAKEENDSEYTERLKLLLETWKAKSIISKSIKKHGGALYSNASYSFDFRGKEYSFNHDKNGHSYSLFWKDQDNKAIKISLQNEQLLKTINNELVQLNPDEIASYREQINSVLFFVLLPFKLEDQNATSAYLGDTKIKGEDYEIVEVNFSEDSDTGNKTTYFFWFHKEKNTMDYLAYKYKGNNGLAVRFRSFYNRRNINGIVFQDYNNYTCDPNSSLKEIAELYEDDKLTYVSNVEITNTSKN